jgi:predicted RNase H-like HicB family nuclease
VAGSVAKLDRGRTVNLRTIVRLKPSPRSEDSTRLMREAQRSEMESQREFTIVFHDTEGDGYVAECLELPGCMAQGETETEAMENIQDAIASCLSVLFEDTLNSAMAERHLGEATFTDVSKQATLRVTLPRVVAEGVV